MRGGDAAIHAVRAGEGAGAAIDLDAAPDRELFVRRLIHSWRLEIRVDILRDAFVGNYQHAFLAHARFDLGAEYEASFFKLARTT